MLPNAFIFVDFGGYEQFLNVRENLRENVRENVRENLRENLRGLHAIFGLFSGIFRSKISGNFVKEEGHSFERAAVTANVRK